MAKIVIPSGKLFTELNLTKINRHGRRLFTTIKYKEVYYVV